MYQHGGDIYSNHIELDFSVSLNPLGMPEGVRHAIISHIKDFETYPDYSCRKLRSAIAMKEGVDADEVICGNGAAELIYDVVHAVKPAHALILAPAFSEYEKALVTENCCVDYFFLKAGQNFTFEQEKDFNDFLKKLDSRYDMVFLCNPNNPSGNILKHDLIFKILDKCAIYNILVLLDECFIDFTCEESFAGAVRQYPNLFLLKAFTKTYSMAGIRLGYGISSNTGLLSRIASMRQCWNVSAVAQTAGAAALKEKDYLNKTQDYVEKERKYLEKELVILGFNVFKSCANYLLFHSGAGIMDQTGNFHDKLLKRQILIRKCDDYKGLDQGFFRIGVRNHSENEILIQTIREIIVQ